MMWLMEYLLEWFSKMLQGELAQKKKSTPSNCLDISLKSLFGGRMKSQMGGAGLLVLGVKDTDKAWYLQGEKRNWIITSIILGVWCFYDVPYLTLQLSTIGSFKTLGTHDFPTSLLGSTWKNDHIPISCDGKCNVNAINIISIAKLQGVFS